MATGPQRIPKATSSQDPHGLNQQEEPTPSPNILGVSSVPVSHAHTRLTTLQKYTYKEGDWTGFYGKCFYWNGRECAGSAGRGIPIPCDYQITDHEFVFEHVRKFKPHEKEGDSGAEDNSTWGRSKIVASKMEIYFHNAACPQCGLKELIDYIKRWARLERDLQKDAGKAGEGDSEQYLNNIRCTAQRAESMYRGVYQSLWKDYENDEAWKKLKADNKWGDWTTIAPIIPGQGEPLGTYAHEPFMPPPATQSSAQT